MNMIESLPDIAKTRSETANYALQWVGMEDIAVPLTLDISDGKQQSIAAKENIYVSLDDATEKGIHMSRLHGILNQLATQICEKEGLDLILETMVSSQAGISKRARMELKFDLLLPKTSLLSKKTGFQTYRVEIHGQRLNGCYDYRLRITIPYSSTCPCSAALSRQLFAHAIDSALTPTWIYLWAIITGHPCHPSSYKSKRRLARQSKPWSSAQMRGNLPD
jgi:GTP cyclohydrolase I